MLNTLTKASSQWASRPADERFVSLHEMGAKLRWQRENARAVTVSSRKLELKPTEDNKGLLLYGPNGHGYAPTHWAFGQLAQRAEAPAGYLRTLPAPIVADCVNYGLQFKRDIEDVGILLQRPFQADGFSEGSIVEPTPVVRAATGPRYGRIWNTEITDSLIKHFGNGVDGDFRVPGTFGHALESVTKENTTLYAGDRDMFVFLADEEHRIEIPNRRNGETGTLARGFFVWNSEVGSSTFGVATFLFDYVCCNRIVWGAAEYDEVRIRHTASAPDKFLSEITPALKSYANSSTAKITENIEAARAARVDNVDDFLAKRFGARTVASLKAVHELEEGRPIETLWDVATAVTAKAKSITWQDERVAMEREAGKVLDLVAA